MCKLSRFSFIAVLLVAPFAASATNYVEMQTNLGTLTIQLFPNRSPVTVENFLKYVNAGFYSCPGKFCSEA